MPIDAVKFDDFWEIANSKPDVIAPEIGCCRLDKILTRVSSFYDIFFVYLLIHCIIDRWRIV